MSWSRMLFCSSLAVACSADAVDLGDGPLTSASAASSGEVVCTSGIDCQGGRCKECLLETCLCDSSDDFKIPACLADGASLVGLPLLSADGASVQFSVCRLGVSCRFYHWTARFGLQEMPLQPEPTYAPTGISADGRQILLTDTDTLRSVLTGQDSLASVYRYDIEHNTGSILPTGILSDVAQLLPSGVVIGLSRLAGGALRLSRWSEQRGLEVLSELDRLLPLAATPDGSMIVGSVVGFATAFQWSERDGLVPDLATAIAGGKPLSVKAVSADGSTIAGEFESFGIFRWSEAKGLVETPGQLVGKDLLLSDDGSVLGGMLVPDVSMQLLQSTGYGGVPFVWSGEFPSPHPATIDASERLFMAGDGAMIISGEESYFGGELTAWSYNQPPRRVQLRGDGFGAISGFSHDGNVAAGAALCGGVDAVLVQQHLRKPNSP